MERIVFHITVNATVIGTLRAHQHKWHRSTDRKKRSFARAQKDFLKKKQDFHNKIFEVA